MYDSDSLRRIGQRLRILRERRGMSIEDAASASGLSPDCIRKYERGEREMGISRIFLAASVLRCSAHNILSAVTDDPAAGEYNTLSPESSATMARLASAWDGDIESLICCMGMIASFPLESRRDIYMQCLIVKDRLLASGALDPSTLPAGISALERSLGGLYDAQ